MEGFNEVYGVGKCRHLELVDRDLLARTDEMNMKGQKRKYAKECCVIRFALFRPVSPCKYSYTQISKGVRKMQCISKLAEESIPWL